MVAHPNGSYMPLPCRRHSFCRPTSPLDVRLVHPRRFRVSCLVLRVHGVRFSIKVVSSRLYGMGLRFSIKEQLLHRNVQRSRGGLAFKARRLCVSLNSRLGSKRRPFHRSTLIIYTLGFNQNHYTFALISLIKIVMCSKLP